MSADIPYTNRLINASSPYLQQHAHNPVDWYEWGEEAWQRARAENKPVLVSIGYSACHWCHVMERETFENEDTAALMNEFFVCIKVDREERPDVDQVYMDAVQLITGQGGWPLNMFCLPDGRPLHGGTYFRNREWNQLLLQLHDFWHNRRADAEEFAQKLTEGVRTMDALGVQPATEKFAPQDIQEMYDVWAPAFDRQEGGNSRVPKFPMPNNWQFLLNYSLLSGNDEAMGFLNLTLEKIARGGINDQLGGGFARYATDGMWLVPHFEKMLYDNAQLTSLYANAYRATGNELYKQTLEQTLEFVARELTDKNGGFYSALDADSEGVEGKYYVWTKEELEIILGENEPLFSAYYNITKEGNWEHGQNILHTRQSLEDFAAKKNMTAAEAAKVFKTCRQKLMAVRNKRIGPGLDDKIICCWNALMLKAYADAWLATGNQKYLDAAIANRAFIEKHLLQNGRLLRIYKSGKSTISAFLEDYACVIDAYIQLYQCTFDETLINTANQLAQTCLTEFYNQQSGLFYFTSETDAPLVARKTDTADDVISSANAILANCLHKLAYYTDNASYKTIAETMLAKMAQQIKKYPSWYSMWANAALAQAYGLYQVVITGENAANIYKEFTAYIPNALFAVTTDGNTSLPLFHHRFEQGKTHIYICKNETCHLPVTSINQAMQLLV